MNHELIWMAQLFLDESRVGAALATNLAGSNGHGLPQGWPSGWRMACHLIAVLSVLLGVTSLALGSDPPADVSAG